MDALSGGDFRSAPQQRYKDPLTTKYLEHNETRGLVKFSRNAWRTKNKPGSIELERHYTTEPRSDCPRFIRLLFSLFLNFLV